MEILSFTSEDFRNLAAEIQEFGAGLNLVVGDNGQGKTNLLEGFAIVSGRSSFRGAEPSAMRRSGAERCRLVARVAGGAYAEAGHLAAVLSEGSREQLWDGKRITRLEAARRLPLVLLTGEDLQRLAGSPSARRRSVDRAAALVEPSHAASLRRYERARASKARLLSAERLDRDELAGFDAILAEEGARVVNARRETTKRLEEELRRQAVRLRSPYRNLSLELVSDAGDATDVGSLREALERRLATRRTEERRARRCLVGPHRDDVRLADGGQLLSDRASSGERRTLVLAWTLAEIRVVADALGTPPVFAFDDFDSEWDARVLRDFASALPPGIQAFLTSARPEALRDLPFPEGRVYTMASGRLTGTRRTGRAELAAAS